MSRKINLTVGGSPVEIDYFIQDFIDHTVSGMVRSLDGTGEISAIRLSIDTRRVGIVLNGVQVPANSFVNDLVRNTVRGMVSTLKGVTDMKDVVIEIGH